MVLTICFGTTIKAEFDIHPSIVKTHIKLYNNSALWNNYFVFI